MTGTLLNDFLVGADPEMVLLDPPELINGMSERKPMHGFYGWDHNGFVLEPHPTPSKSVREVVRNIRKSLHVIGHQFGDYKFRAGAYLHTPQRPVTLGGHVHLDMPTLNGDQIGAMDVFTQSLVGLDILPQTECAQRQGAGGYGRWGDIRAEHGHVEYRSMCSWLFSQKTAMLSMTGIKLAAIAPATVKPMDSYAKMGEWLTGFKGKDDDVDWVLDRGYLTESGSMTAKPDNNIKSVWRIDPEQGERLMEAAAATRPPVPPLGTVGAFNEAYFVDNFRRQNGFNPSLVTIREARCAHENRARLAIYGPRGVFNRRTWAQGYEQRHGRVPERMTIDRAFERHLLAFPLPMPATIPQLQAQPLPANDDEAWENQPEG